GLNHRLAYKIEYADPLRPVFEHARHRQRRDLQIPMTGRRQLLQRPGFFLQVVDEHETREAECFYLGRQTDEFAAKAAAGTVHDDDAVRRLQSRDGLAEET